VLAVPSSALTTGAFRGSRAVRDGLLTPRQLRGRSWRRLFTDVYVASSVPVTHELRARAAAGLLQPAAVVTGRSAAVLWGVPLAGPDDDVELTLPPGTHPVRTAGLHVRRADLDDKQVHQLGGVWVTGPNGTAAHLAGVLPRDEAVVAVDRLVAAGLADLASVRWLAGSALGPGSRRARQACALADGLAESPQETRLRLLLHDSGLPMPTAQYRVQDATGVVARVDFGWPAQRLALEYDGLWHAEPGQFARDRQRLNRLTAAGWRVVFVTAADLHQPTRLIARIVAALAA
jgi:very-short-patch-repair endonuclease